MIIAHHLIWTAYGWWLPNDPRGSTSHEIASDVIAELGALHHGRRRIQPASGEIQRFYEAAAGVLRHELLSLAPSEAQCVGDALARVVARRRYTCWACAVMPDHVHLLIRKHRDRAEEMIGELQCETRDALQNAGLRGAEHPVWGGPGWKVFQDHPDDVWRTIAYIRDNPCKLGRPVQEWLFVTPYNNWPFHPGHSPNSPYARRRRGEPF